MPEGENKFRDDEEFGEERKAEDFGASIKKSRRVQPRTRRLFDKLGQGADGESLSHQSISDIVAQRHDKASIQNVDLNALIQEEAERRKSIVPEHSFSKIVGGEVQQATLPDGSTYKHRESKRTIDRDGETLRGKEEFNEWIEKDFDLAESINNARGPFIEIAGPTHNDYDLLRTQGQRVDMEVVNNKLKVSNIARSPGADFSADARQMPIKDESVGMVFCSCLGPKKISGEELLSKNALYNKRVFETYSEAARMLRPGGLMVMQGRMAEDLSMEKALGFKVKQYAEYRDELTDPKRGRFDIILEKPNVKTVGQK